MNQKPNFTKLLCLCMAISLVFTYSACKKTESSHQLSKESATNARAASSVPSFTFNKNPFNVVYVEVNDQNFANVAAYSMKSDGKAAFDMAIIFAANINYDDQQKKAVLHLNSNVNKVLVDRSTYIKPVQDRGTKVLLSILPNHQGVGFRNFQTKDAAKDFAQQLANAVTTYGLDGIDFDEEYADYSVRSELPTNNSSFMWLVQELRTLIPDKVISFYNIGMSTADYELGTDKVGDYVNYSWNPYYGSFSSFTLPGMTEASRIGAAAIDISVTDASQVDQLANSTKTNNNGIMLWYNLNSQDKSSLLSTAATILYQDEVTLTGTLNTWQKVPE